MVLSQLRWLRPWTYKDETQTPQKGRRVIFCYSVQTDRGKKSVGQLDLNQASPVLVFCTWHCIAGHVPFLLDSYFFSSIVALHKHWWVLNHLTASFACSGDGRSLVWWQILVVARSLCTWWTFPLQTQQTFFSSVLTWNSLFLWVEIVSESTLTEMSSADHHTVRRYRLCLEGLWSLRHEQETYSAFRQKFPKLWTSVAHSFLQQIAQNKNWADPKANTLPRICKVEMQQASLLCYSAKTPIWGHLGVCPTSLYVRTIRFPTFCRSLPSVRSVSQYPAWS